MKFRFRLSTILWAIAVFAATLSAYEPVAGVLAASLAIVYWWIIYRWYEEEHEFQHVILLLFIGLGPLEGAYSDYPRWPRLIPVLLFVVLCFLPFWRKREPWYEKY